MIHNAAAFFKPKLDFFFAHKIFDALNGVHELSREDDGAVFLGGNLVEHL
jgi:hypothetical protein